MIINFSILLTEDDSEMVWNISKDYEIGKEYNIGDLVSLDDILYIADSDNTPNSPTTTVG